MENTRLKVYVIYSSSYGVLLNDFLIPSLKNTDLELVAKKVEQMDTVLFGSESWSSMMLKKVDFVIEAVQENWGSIFVVSDVDVQFFKNVSQNIRSYMIDKDIIFQSDDHFGRINAGFFACKGNDTMLGFWREVQKRLEKSITSGKIHFFAEQYFIREILSEKPCDIRYSILPVDEYGSPRTEYTPDKKIFLSDTLRIYHTTWTLGMENKIHHSDQIRMSVQKNDLHKRLSFFVCYYSIIFRYPRFFFKREREFFREKYHKTHIKIGHKSVPKDPLWIMVIFIVNCLQILRYIYFCILYVIKKRDYSCYPFWGDMLWHRYQDLHLPKEPVIFHSSKNGFFSIFIEALGYLDYCEKRAYSPKILLDTGYYLDVGQGPNWWDYYFERVSMHHDNSSHEKTIAHSVLPDCEYIFGDYSRSYLSLKRKNEIFHKYIKIHDTILDEAHNFIEDEFRDFFIVGCHIRGTDKRTEIRRTYSIETVTREINKILRNKSNYKIFLATDDQEYFLAMKSIYKDKIISRDCVRLDNPVHLNKEHQGYRIGKEVLLDCLILSQCHYFIGGSSNVSHSVLIVNPNIKHKIMKFVT